MTGLVSINGGTAVTAQQSDTSVNVPVSISGSDSFNGFSIQIHADTSFLSGASVSLAGSVLPNPTILGECINGVLIAGNGCPTQDQNGVVFVSAANQAGGSAAAGVSGPLFTITYTITGQTTGTPIAFNVGCTSTSTGTADCVFVDMGAVTDSEADQSTTFSNLVDFTMTPVFTSLSTPSGVMISDNINFAAVGGYQDILDVSTTSTAGLACSVSSPTVDLTTPSGTGSDTLTCSGTSTGSVTVTATGEGVLSPPQPRRTHSVTIPVKIAPAGFSITLSQTSVTISAGSSDSSTTINAQGFSGFSGTVSFTSSSAPGIMGTAPSVTLTHDGSGYSTGTSTLTISVASSVSSGTYTLTVTGSSGSSNSMASISVTVPSKDFSVVANPDNQLIIRGASVGATITLNSAGNFAGSATLTATVSPVTGEQDSCCLTNNITPAFSSTTATLPPGGSVSVDFSASTVGTLSPTTQTATGNYTITITATISGTPRTTTIFFALYDFGIGPAFCTGGNLVPTSESAFGALDSPQFLNDTFSGMFIGPPCNSLTITDQNQVDIVTPFLGGNLFGEVDQAQILWIKTNSFGGINTGLATNGWNGTPSVAASNTEIPFNGISVPQLAGDFPVNGTRGNFWPSKACVVPTFWPNGTQVPYSYISSHGPLIIPGTGIWAFLSTIFSHRTGQPLVPPGALGNWGCRFDAAAFPNDAGVVNDDPVTGTGDCTNPKSASSDDCANGVHVARYNNPDYFAVTALAIAGTLPGVYSFQFCAQAGILRHCNMYSLNVVAAPQVHQLVYSRTVSFSASHGVELFKLGIANPGTSTIFVQATITATGSLGDTLTATTPVLTIRGGSAANNIALSFALTSDMIGETFSWSFSMAVGSDGVNFDGISTETSTARATGTFTVTA